MYRAAIGSVFVRLEMHSDAIPILEQCVFEEPDNDTYNWFLALAYNDVCITAWPQAKDGSYLCTSESDAEKSIEFINKAQQLKHNDNDLKNMINMNAKVAQWAKDQHWSRSIIGTIKSGFFALIGASIAAVILESAIGGGGGTAIGIIAFIGVIALWFKLGFKPGWQINKTALEMQRYAP